MKKIVLGVSSSISLYKACDIIRGFQKRACQVQVIMTKNATRLVSPLLLSSLSGQRVIVDPLQEEAGERIEHIALAKEALLFLVAPATANLIGKMASGIADDFLTTFYLAVKSPVLLAPAMNEAMYFHPQTQKNIRILKETGIHFITPEKGSLACGEEGWGRLAPAEKIVEAGLGLIDKGKSLAGKTILLTAGPTREHMDPVRFLSNPSSGKMGYALAEEASSRGARVVLVSGPTQMPSPPGVERIEVTSAEEMDQEVNRIFPSADVFIATAAVSDYKFDKKYPHKLKKEEKSVSFRLIPTPDILKKAAKIKGEKILAGFAAETENVVENARRKLKEKNLDLIIANDISREALGFGSDINQVVLIFPDGRIISPEAQTKRQLSRLILDEVEVLLEKRIE
ncbi:MAG: bifunctional phosphopantothenoylcysteine decarboxylase/phosphopantothenate--cysteine ligase CoaBC [Acidobacteriota bacterium]